MHPAVALILAEASRGFGEGFGKAFGDGLAGLLLGDGGAGDARLGEILNRLDQLERELSRLIRLVEKIPEVVLRIGQLLDVEAAYRRLEATRAVLRNDPHRTLNDQIRIEALAQWLTIINLESRPDMLLRLPYWTELMRHCGIPAEDLCERLELKVRLIGSSLAESSEILSESLTEAGTIIRSRFFKSGAVTSEPPYITWKPKPVPYIMRHISGRDSEPIDEVIYDEGWRRAQAVRVKRLRALAAISAAQSNKLRSLLPVQRLLSDYMRHLGCRVVEREEGWVAQSAEIPRENLASVTIYVETIAHDAESFD